MVIYSNRIVAYPDGSTDTLRVPEYQIKNLRNGHPVNFMISPRIAPQLVGMGLLEAIPEQTILSYASPNDTDNDGISGKANYVWCEEKSPDSFGTLWVEGKSAKHTPTSGWSF
ncbi:MAG: di-heme oxidoredictase family protein [Cyclobacteriaceae bacterium]